MIFFRTVALLFSAVLSLSACQSHSVHTLEFGTRITDDGYKLFQLVYPQAEPELRLPSQSQHRREPRPAVSEKRVLSVLEKTIETNGYCREGYTLLGRYAGETTNRIRGECHDKANTMDRQLYPDTITQW